DSYDRCASSFGPLRTTCSPFSFFFQAEDGIRGDLVTGVQTCALPIFQGQVARGRADQQDKARQGCRLSTLCLARLAGFRNGSVRSEERRVGKECRCRWSPDDEKKRIEATRGKAEQG